MISTTSASYLPLLEGHAGKVYLSNNATLNLGYVVSGGVAPDPVTAVNSGVIAISPSSSNGYQGRLGINFVPGVGGGWHELSYNGANWDPSMVDNFSMYVVLKDIAYSTASNFDLYPFFPGPVPGTLDVLGTRSGGSDYGFYVWTLGLPEVAAISPTSIPTDGAPHVVTVSLKRRLHSSQTPTVSFSPSGAASVTLGTPLAVRNAAGQITAWTFTATANPQQTGVIAINMTASETLTYLKDDLIVTELVTYCTALNIGNLTVTTVSGAEPLTIVTQTLAAGSGADTYHGYLFGNNNTGVFAGALTAVIEMTEGNGNIGPVSLVAKPTGTNSRQELAMGYGVDLGAVPSTTGSGNTVYKRGFTFNVDTAALAAYPSWDFGFSNYDPSGLVVLQTTWMGTYLNGNLSTNLPTYTILAVVGSSSYLWHPTTGWEGTVPEFKGVVNFYISENWNPTQSGGLDGAWDSLRYRVDGGAWVVAVDGITKFATRNSFPSLAMACPLATLDTSGWANSNHTIEWEMGAAFMTFNIGAGMAGTATRSSVVTFATNQSVSGGTVPSFNITKTSGTATFDQATGLDTSLTFSTSTSNLYSGAVTFSVTGLPDGATAIFSPPNGTFIPTSSTGPATTLTINASGCVLGSYPIGVYATSNGVDKIVPLNLIVSDSSLGGGGGPQSPNILVM